MAAEYFDDQLREPEPFLLESNKRVGEFALSLCKNEVGISPEPAVVNALEQSIERVVGGGGGIVDPEVFLKGLDSVVKDMVSVAPAHRVPDGTRDCSVVVLRNLGKVDINGKFESAIEGLSEETMIEFLTSLMAMMSSPFWTERDNSLLMTNSGRYATLVTEKIPRNFSAAAVDCVKTFAKSLNWHDHHTALTVICQFAMKFPEVLRDSLDQVVPILLNFLEDPHCHVLPAVTDTSTVLGSHLVPTIQQNYGGQILPLLAKLIGNEKPTVQLCDAQAIGSFSKACTPDILQPFLTEIVSKLIGLLEKGNEKAKGHALTALALVASSSQVGQVFVRMPLGNIMAIPVEACQTSIKAVKLLIECREGIQVVDQVLIFGGKVLNDDLLLSDYAVHSESTLELSLRLLGGAPSWEQNLKTLVRREVVGLVHRNKLQGLARYGVTAVIAFHLGVHQLALIQNVDLQAYIDHLLKEGTGVPPPVNMNSYTRLARQLVGSSTAWEFAKEGVYAQLHQGQLARRANVPKFTTFSKIQSFADQAFDEVVTELVWNDAFNFFKEGDAQQTVDQLLEALREMHGVNLANLISFFDGVRLQVVSWMSRRRQGTDRYLQSSQSE